MYIVLSHVKLRETDNYLFSVFFNSHPIDIFGQQFCKPQYQFHLALITFEEWHVSFIVHSGLQWHAQITHETKVPENCSRQCLKALNRSEQFFDTPCNWACDPYNPMKCHLVNEVELTIWLLPVKKKSKHWICIGKVI